MKVAGFSVVTLLTLGLIAANFLNGGPTAISETQIAAAANEEDFAVYESGEDQEPTVERSGTEDVKEGPIAVTADSLIAKLKELHDLNFSAHVTTSEVQTQNLNIKKDFTHSIHLPF